MRVTTTTAGGPVATMSSDQVNAEFSHLMWSNFSGLDHVVIRELNGAPVTSMVISDESLAARVADGRWQ